MSVQFTEYYPFDTPHGQPANATRWSKMARYFTPDGLAMGVFNGLAASISAGQATISSGAVVIHGYYAELQTSAQFAVGTNGMIVAGADLVGETVSVYYKDGATDYNNLQRDDSVWEIPLYLVSGTPVTPKWIGNTVSGGRSLTTFFENPPPNSYVNLPAGQTVTYNLGTIRVSQPCLLSLQVKTLLNVPNAAVQLTVSGSIVVQAGLPDEASHGLLWMLNWPGGGPNGAAAWFAGVDQYTWLMNTPGKKTVGMRFQATGQASNAADIQMMVRQAGAMANA